VTAKLGDDTSKTLDIGRSDLNAPPQERSTFPRFGQVLLVDNPCLVSNQVTPHEAYVSCRPIIWRHSRL
jgi:hypothetical protein